MIRYFLISLALLPLIETTPAHANCDSAKFSNNVLQSLRVLPEFSTSANEIILIRAPKTIIYNESHDQYRCRYTLDLKSGKSKEISVEYKGDKSGELSFAYEEF